MAGPENPPDPAVIERLIADLRTLVKGDILTPESSGYGLSILRWSDAVPNRPAVVVLPESAEEVSATVQECGRHQMPFAVACGKHTTSSGSSCYGGLIIDLGKMNGVEVRPESKTVLVGGGCRFRDVDEALEGTGLAVVEGIVNDTGVGGITLGGGYGWLAGRHGLVLDNVLSVKMVLADGRIVTASNDENQDLFWAVRGAGQCFGVAVEFLFQAHEHQDPVWAGLLGFPLEKLEAVIAFANNMVEMTQGDSAMVVQIGMYPFASPPGGIAVNAIVFHNGPLGSARSVFQPLIDMSPLLDTTKEQSYASVNGMLNPMAIRGGRNVSKGAAYTLPLRPGFIREQIVPDFETLQGVGGGNRSFIEFEFYQPHKWCSIPRDATAHGHRGNHQNVMIALYWYDASEDVRMEKWSRSIANKVDMEQRANGFGGSLTEYGNYDHLSAEPQSVFGDCYRRLVEMKRKWDPNNVFRQWYDLV